ncbi:MAG: MBL fold metallo-hydrolase RNA specificity domain-containing protein [Conexivisphaerales archaeon]
MVDFAGGMLRVNESGMFVNLRDKTIALDPRRKVKADYVFISHAHSDHLPASVGDSTVIASEETVTLAKARGLKIERHVDSLPGIELPDTGHILGSRGILVDGVLYYTGDIAGRKRGFMNKGRPVSCETLLVETTYGRENFSFPPLAEILLNANKLISGALEAGRPAIIQGYPLGKSQVLTYLFQSWSPLYVYGNVNIYNRIYRELGVELPQAEPFPKNSSLISKHGVIVFPTTGDRGETKKLISKSKATVIRFTGWAITKPFANEHTTMLPVSDHADYFELLKFVSECRPEYVLTTHGYAKDFAFSLRRYGFRAKPLQERQIPLTEYFE